jgi:hypothetical protein
MRTRRSKKYESKVSSTHNEPFEEEHMVATLVKVLHLPSTGTTPRRREYCHDDPNASLTRLYRIM